MIRIKRSYFKDKDFIELKEGFYQVIGYEHPSNYVVAIPRYIKTNYATLWNKNGIYYERVLKDYGLRSINKALKKFSANYYIYDEIFDTYLSLIPKNLILKKYFTDDWASYLINESNLFLKFLEILNILSKESNVSSINFGLTGTLLINIFNALFSDIDIVIFGEKNVEKLKNFLKENKINFAKILSKEELKKEAYIHNTNLKTLKKIYERKWNKGKYKGRIFSINPVKKDEEILFKYGDIKYKNIKEIKIECKIEEKIDPYFFPLRYKIKDVKILKNNTKFFPEEIVIFNDFFVDSFEEDDKIIVNGLLQKVIKKEKEFFRIAFGVKEVKNQFLIFK